MSITDSEDGGADGWVGYEGEWQDGQRHGKGKMVWGADCSYEGEVSLCLPVSLRV